MCNLISVVIRENDTPTSIKEKVEIATIIGTMQASITHFRYLRKQWKINTEEDALLGVSLTGIMDNDFFSNANNPELPKVLQELKDYSIEVNKDWANKLGINPSAAITCIKPEGNSSQLNNTSSGIHPRFSKYYIRTVRQTYKDSLTQYMIDMGIPNEPEVNNPDKICVFSFPVKAPNNCKIASDFGAMDQLNIWKIYSDYWVEHNVSCTIYVRDHEWIEVSAWVYKNFNEIGGLSFLPYSENIYKQAPYQAVTEEEYNELLEKFPKDVDFSTFYEDEDNTTASHELACVGGKCELN
jgi:ribonucleoside-diphosphate reductase alpha chain